MTSICPGCGTVFEPVPPSRRFCRPVCGAKHQRRGQAVLPLFDVLVTELPPQSEHGRTDGQSAQSARLDGLSNTATD